MQHKRKKSGKLCYLCGQPNADSKDHVPPRGIFPSRPKGQLLTVPAHTSCNNRFSKDDELIRNLIIAASWRSGKGSQAWDEQVLPSTRKNPGAKKELLDRLFPLWIKDPLSGRLVRHMGLRMEVSLFHRQIRRWMKGLFYHRFQKPLPSSVVINVEKLQIPEISLPPLNDMMASRGLKPNWIHVDQGVFSYFYPVAKQDENVGFAIFVFFNTEVYMASTGMVKQGA